MAALTTSLDPTDTVVHSILFFDTPSRSLVACSIVDISTLLGSSYRLQRPVPENTICGYYGHQPAWSRTGMGYMDSQLSVSVSRSPFPCPCSISTCPGAVLSACNGYCTCDGYFACNNSCRSLLSTVSNHVCIRKVCATCWLYIHYPYTYWLTSLLIPGNST
ncbi:hypothetical protein C8Q80DRAFT_1189101 [Daedaleopsis nitida]|nr:hypothetical protein C8Q80DRAFT_1189101 [Daedaleopsis nitida]